MFIIFNKEIKNYFDSLYGFVMVVIFFLINSLIVWFFPSTNVFQYGFGSLDVFFEIVPYIFMFIVPALTMKSISEEKNLGTFEILLSQPISLQNIVFGKLLSSWFISFLLVFFTFPYWISIYNLSNPIGNIDSLIIINSYLGLILLVGSMNSIGIFFSSLSQNQILSFILSAFFLVLLNKIIFLYFILINTNNTARAAPPPPIIIAFFFFLLLTS